METSLTGDTAAEVKKLGEGLKITRELTLAVIIVLFVAFAAMFVAIGGYVVNVLAERKTEYKELEKSVSAQNYKIDLLILLLSRNQNLHRDIELVGL